MTIEILCCITFERIHVYIYTERSMHRSGKKETCTDFDPFATKLHKCSNSVCCCGWKISYIENEWVAFRAKTSTNDYVLKCCMQIFGYTIRILLCGIKRNAAYCLDCFQMPRLLRAYFTWIIIPHVDVPRHSKVLDFYRFFQLFDNKANVSVSKHLSITFTFFLIFYTFCTDNKN